MKTLVITGGSNGIGRAAAKKFRSEGYRVFELSRRGKDEDGIVHVTADVSDEQSVKNAFEQISRQTDRIDVLICNAGFGISGAADLPSLTTPKSSLTLTSSAPF